MKTRLGLTMVLAIGAVAGANAAMFINGNFETGDMSFWSLANTANGQTFAQNVIQYDIDGPGTRPTNFAAQFQVGQVTFNSGVPAGIELTQTLTLNAGWQYYFDFDWAAQRNSGGNNTQAGIFSLIVDGNAIATQVAGASTGTTPIYGHVTGVFTPTTTGAYTIGARIERPFTPASELYQYVDNFAVTAIVPEPATMAVLGLGLAAMARRRRNK